MEVTSLFASFSSFRIVSQACPQSVIRPPKSTIAMPPQKSQSGKRMWPFSFSEMPLETANWWSDVANMVLVASLVVGVAATFVVVKAGNVKEAFWDKAREDAIKDISEANARGEEAKKEASKANERTATLELEAEKLRHKNLLFERALNPRQFEQSSASQRLKKFSDVEALVLSEEEYEAKQFAGRINVTLFQITGWKQFQPVGMEYPQHFFDGVVVHTNLGTKNAQRAARVLVDILMEVGIDAKIGWPIKELGDRGILVLVGPRPIPPEIKTELRRAKPTDVDPAEISVK